MANFRSDGAFLHLNLGSVSLGFSAIACQNWFLNGYAIAHTNKCYLPTHELYAVVNLSCLYKISKLQQLMVQEQLFFVSLRN